jgi:hypothetical protein
MSVDYALDDPLPPTALMQDAQQGNVSQSQVPAFADSPRGPTAPAQSFDQYIQSAPFGQADIQRINQLQAGLSGLDKQVMSGELHPVEAQAPKREIMGQLGPLLQKKQQSQQKMMQEQAQQAMHAAAMQAGVENVNRQVQAEAIPSLIRTHTDPVTGETMHLVRDHKGDVEELKFEREAANKDRITQSQAEPVAEEGPPAGTGDQPDGSFIQRIRNGDQYEFHRFTPRPGGGFETQPIGQGQQMPGGQLSAGALQEIFRRADQAVPQPKGQGPGGRFLNPRMAALAQQQRRAAVESLAHSMVNDAQRVQEHQRHETSMSAERQRAEAERRSQMQEKLQEQQRQKHKDHVEDYLKHEKALTRTEDGKVHYPTHEEIVQHMKNAEKAKTELEGQRPAAEAPEQKQKFDDLVKTLIAAPPAPTVQPKPPSTHVIRDPGEMPGF